MDVAKVGSIYQQLNKYNLDLLDGIYHQDVVFEDAAHRIEGWPELKRYFSALYSNVDCCHFDIQSHQQQGDAGFITWIMNLQHPKLQRGRSIYVHGVSHLKFDQNKVIYHRDYFDLGEMLYENLPLLGSVIRTIKQRLGE